MNTEIAVILFARDASKEALHKSFLSTGVSNVRLWKRMEHRTVSTIKKTGLDYFRFSQTEQRGSSFGQRVNNALKQVFDIGYKKIILLGNDCPTLSHLDILDSAAQLQQNKIVLGEDTRGGAYLLGFHRDSITDSCIEKFAWKTHRLIDTIRSYAILSSLSVAYIQQRKDLNFKYEFAFLQRTNQAIIDLIKDLLFAVHFYTYHSIRSRLSYCSQVTMRGPPCL